ncbi:hypothetical protein MK079_00670 [Candidatus Gracilibacteria bacterium]|nr:hypothetical protein [Candidatus Gracilibacteria bacterium]
MKESNIVVYLENKVYKISKGILFILFSIKNNHFEIYNLIDHLSENGYFFCEKEIQILIVNSIIITSLEEKEKYDYWFKYGWGDVLYYLLGTKDYEFIDYSTKKGFQQDLKMMKEYVDLKNKEPIDRKIYKSESYKLEHIELPFTSIKEYYNGNCLSKDSVHLDIKEKLSLLLKTSFGKIGVNNMYGKKFNKKCSPSGGSRHPTEAYLFDLNGLFKEDSIFYYDFIAHELKLHSKEKKLLNTLNDFSYNYESNINYKPNFGILITSNFVKSMWRYRDSRSFRVIFNDVGHILTHINYIANILGLEYTEFSFLDDDEVLDNMNFQIDESIMEKPIYFIMFK